MSKLQDQRNGNVVNPHFCVSMSSPPRTRNKSYQQAVIMSSFEDMAKEADFIDPEAFAKSDNDAKLLTIITSLNKLHTKLDTVNNDIHKEK